MMSHSPTTRRKDRENKKRGRLLLTRLATFSAFSNGCRNSAVRSMADCATGTVAGLGTARGVGSSLSSSSSIRVGSEHKGSRTKKMFKMSLQVTASFQTPVFLPGLFGQSS